MFHLDLFAGIGGFSLAAQWMGWETVAQVEWDAWCQKVLAKNFPDALRFGDIVEFNKMLEDGRITTNTEGAGLLREKELENNSQNNGTRRGCDSSNIHQIHRENGEITTDTNGCGYIHGKLTEQSTKRGVNALSQSDEGDTHGKINLGHIDIITGGFPCQPFSHAGKRKGTDDSRYLWPAMLETIRRVKPTYVVGENVAGLVSMENGKTLDRILSDLEDEGYTTEQVIIPACAVGAWHRRDRIWIIAYNNNSGNRASRGGINGDGQEKNGERQQPQSESCGYSETIADTIGQPAGGKGRAACDEGGRANEGGREGIRQGDGEVGTGGVRTTGTGDGETSTHTPNPRTRANHGGLRQGPCGISGGEETGKEITPNSEVIRGERDGRTMGEKAAEPVCKDDGAILVGSSEDDAYCNNQRLQGRSEAGDIKSIGEKRNEQSERYRQCSGGAYWQSEPSVGRVANGIPNRVDRLKGLGNAIVPQVAYEVFRAIEQYELSLLNVYQPDGDK